MIELKEKLREKEKDKEWPMVNLPSSLSKIW